MLAFFAATAPRAEDPKSITVALPLDYHPIAGNNLAGEPSGIMPDIWRLWSAKTGIRVDFLMDDFAGSVEAVRNGRADLHGSIFLNEQRATWLDFSRTLHEATSGIYRWAADNSTTDLDSLRGRAIGALRGTHQEKRLREGSLGLRVRAFTTVMDSLRALARGEVAAVVHEDLSMDTLVRRAGISGEIVRLPVEIARNGIHAGIPKSSPEIRDLVDWGFSLIGYEEFQAIEQRWIRDASAHFFKPRGSKIPFNEAEQRWLDGTRAIRIGMLNNWPPMNAVAANGEPEGMSPAFLKLINQRLGGIVQTVPGSWDEITTGVKEGRLDAHMDISALRSRQANYSFTRPYLVVPYVIVGRRGSSAFTSLSDLNGKTIAVEAGYATASFLRDDFPSIRQHLTDGARAALLAVAAGDADAYLGNQAVVNYLLGTDPDRLSGLEIRGSAPNRQSVLTIGARKDLPILRDILDKTIVGISPAVAARIANPWLGGAERRRIELSPAEQKWLSRYHNRPVRVAADDWPPFSIINEGEPKGIAIEYARQILTELGLTVQVIPLSWTKALDGIEGGKTIDLIPDVARSESRVKQLAFTKDFLSFPRVVFARNDSSLFTNVRQLIGKTVAVEKNFITEELLARDYPGIKQLVFESTHDALEAVSVGKADAYIGNLAAGSYHIERHGLSNLKVVAPTEYDNDRQAMAVRKDWPELASMIDKVLRAMTDEEHAAIRNKSLTIRFEHGINMEKILSIAAPVMAVLLLIIGLVAYSNRKLAREVGERKKVESNLKESENWFKSLLESAPDATIIIDTNGIIKRVNIQTEALFGYDRDEIVGAPVEVLLPEDVRARHPALRDSFMREVGIRPMGMGRDLFARAKNGTVFPAEVSLSPMDTADGREVVATVRDVTQRREAEDILKKNLDELQAFNRLAVDRELRMIELKKEINELNTALGKSDKYEIVE